MSAGVRYHREPRNVHSGLLGGQTARHICHEHERSQAGHRAEQPYCAALVRLVARVSTQCQLKPLSKRRRAEAAAELRLVRSAP